MITAYVKPTNRCNVGCTHCYLPESVRADKRKMTNDVLLSTARFLKQMQVRGRHKSAHVLWHGGEPLVLPADWYYEAGDLLDRELPGHTQSMQTSLIPLRPEHVELIVKRLGGFVGSSIDFSQRMIQNSVENYHRLWMTKVDMVRVAGVEVIPGVVPTRNELGRELEMVRWFVDRDFLAFNIDRYNAYGTSFPDRPSNLEHSKFLIGLFDALMQQMQDYGRAPMVGAIKASITGVLYGVGGDRWGGSCMNDFVVVEPDGELNNCPDKAPFEESFGNVENGFDEFLKSKFRRKWVKHQTFTHKQDFCFTCENQHFCGSGCPITPNGRPEGEDECSGYKTHLSHVRKFSENPANKAIMVSYLEQLNNNAMLDAATQYGSNDQSGCVL